MSFILISRFGENISDFFLTIRIVRSSHQTFCRFPTPLPEAFAILSPSFEGKLELFLASVGNFIDARRFDEIINSFFERREFFVKVSEPIYLQKFRFG